MKEEKEFGPRMESALTQLKGSTMSHTRKNISFIHRQPMLFVYATKGGIGNNGLISHRKSELTAEKRGARAAIGLHQRKGSWVARHAVVEHPIKKESDAILIMQKVPVDIYQMKK